MSSPAVKVVGFDIFDTVITRRVHTPADLFLVVARRLAKDKLIAQGATERWRRDRARIEQLLRQAAGPDEVRLQEIYNAMALRWGWRGTDIAQAHSIEVATEAEFAAPVAATIVKIKQMQADGSRKPVLISDSYMTREQLAHLIGPHLGPLAPSLYVSSESRATKASGKLFALVKAAEAPDLFTEHHGDNLRSDVRAARAQGLRAHHVKTALPSRYENALASQGGIEASLAAGCARVARVGRSFSDTRDQTFWNIGANVIGPFIGGYVLWVLQRAQALGLKRLYFVSRDGQIMLRLASLLVEALRAEIECRYLFGSRQAWHAAALDADGDALPSWLTEHSDSRLTTDAALRRLGFEADDAVEWASNTPPSLDAGASIQLLKRLDKFRTHLQAIARQRRQSAAAYLRQEGLSDGVPFGIVDVGWVGRAHRSLETVMQQELGMGPCHGFYIGLRLEKSDETVAAFRHQYISPGSGLGSRVVHLRGDLIEIMCAADHGGVLGYEVNSQGTVIPALGQAPGHYEARLVLLQQKAAESFVAELCQAVRVAHGSWDQTGHILHHGAERALSRFAVWPSTEEANAYGSFRHDISQEGDPLRREYAPKIHICRLKDILKCRWREGSLSRSIGASWLRTGLQTSLFALNIARRSFG